MVIKNSIEIASRDGKNADNETFIPLLNKLIQTEKNAGNKHENMDPTDNSFKTLETYIGTAREEEGTDEIYATKKVMEKGGERGILRDRRQAWKAFKENEINGTMEKAQKNPLGEDKEIRSVMRNGRRKA